MRDDKSQIEWFIFWAFPKDDLFLEVFLLLRNELLNDFGDVSDENWGLGKVKKDLIKILILQFHASGNQKI